MNDRDKAGLKRFFGGQLEVQNVRAQHYRIGEISSIHADETTIIVQLSWNARKIDGCWVRTTAPNFIAELADYVMTEGEDGRLLFNSVEHGSFNLSAGAILDISKVEGLGATV